MAANENIKLIKARYEAVNAHDLDRFQGFYAGSIVWEDPGLPSAIKGPVAVRRRLEDLTTSFPDLQWKLGRIFSQGEHVCAEFTFTGTHKGALADNRSKQSLRATNQRIRIQAIGVYTIRRNKIVDSKIYFDFGSLKAQLQKQDKRPRKGKS
jgi:steroid delta-isomerase-like uncharacterized protein